jgi:2,4-dienoyl-CoA reductase-like NADH-dependent reductase (Old Yellow Enzyme family)
LPERTDYLKIGHFHDVASFRARLAELGLDLGCEDEIEAAPSSPLAQPCQIGPFRVGNRFAIHPMEGWDGTEDGRPSGHTLRRWERFGSSGAKLIWGGEAVAVRHDGRANPNQLVIRPDTVGDLAALRERLITAHRERFGQTDDLLVGLQLTHSGRFCRPNRKDRMEPQIVYHHPILDHKFHVDPDQPVLTDDEIREIIAHYHAAARLAARAGFQFLDVKHCHGYLGHEFLSAFTREGPYGGSFENRTRFLREIVAGIRRDLPEMLIGVRLSAFDLVPYRPDPDRSTPRQLGPGIPEPFEECLPYRYGFGTDVTDPAALDLDEAFRFLKMLREMGIRFVNVTAGSPYYNPHIQRPAIYPPSDGYQPPEDPLLGVERQIVATRRIKERFPDFVLVGTAYTYLQEFLPHVAQHEVRSGGVDFVGLGRMVLAYHDLPADVLERGELRTKQLCRTFSDCTTAPRNGMISGCFPLDTYYKAMPLRKELIAIKLGKRRV